MAHSAYEVPASKQAARDAGAMAHSSPISLNTAPTSLVQPHSCNTAQAQQAKASRVFCILFIRFIIYLFTAKTSQSVNTHIGETQVPDRTSYAADEYNNVSRLPLTEERENTMDDTKREWKQKIDVIPQFAFILIQYICT